MIDYQKITQDAVHEAGGRANLGNLLKKAERTIGNWISGHNKPSGMNVVKIIKVLINSKNEEFKRHAQKTWTVLWHTYFLPLKELLEMLGLLVPEASVPKELLLFDKVELAIIVQNEEGERRGRSRIFSRNKGEITPEAGLFKSKTNAAVAEAFGLGGEEKFRLEKRIWEEKREDLMKAVNIGLISVECAYALLPFSREMVAVKLTEGRAAVLAFLKEQKQAIQNNVKEKVPNDDIKKED